jgi:hypothetical protein
MRESIGWRKLLFYLQMRWGPRCKQVEMAAIVGMQNNLGTMLVMQLVSCNRFRYSYLHSWGTEERTQLVDCTKADGPAEGLNLTEHIPGWRGAVRKWAAQVQEEPHTVQCSGTKAMEIGGPEP